MITLLSFLLALLFSPFNSRSQLEAENAMLRRQLIVLRGKVRGRAALTNADRWFLVQLYRWFPSILDVLSVPRHYFAGIGRAFVAIGVGSLVAEGARRFTRNCARSYGE